MIMKLLAKLFSSPVTRRSLLARSITRFESLESRCYLSADLSFEFSGLVEIEYNSASSAGLDDVDGMSQTEAVDFVWGDSIAELPLSHWDELFSEGEIGIVGEGTEVNEAADQDPVFGSECLDLIDDTSVAAGSDHCSAGQATMPPIAQPGGADSSIPIEEESIPGSPPIDVPQDQMVPSPITTVADNPKAESNSSSNELAGDDVAKSQTGPSLSAVPTVRMGETFLISRDQPDQTVSISLRDIAEILNAGQKQSERIDTAGRNAAAVLESPLDDPRHHAASKSMAIGATLIPVVSPMAAKRYAASMSSPRVVPVTNIAPQLNRKPAFTKFTDPVDEKARGELSNSSPTTMPGDHGRTISASFLIALLDMFLKSSLMHAEASESADKWDCDTVSGKLDLRPEAGKSMQSEKPTALEGVKGDGRVSLRLTLSLGLTAALVSGFPGFLFHSQNRSEMERDMRRKSRPLPVGPVRS